MESRKEINLRPSHQVVHFKPKIKGLMDLHYAQSLPLLPCIHLTNDIA